MISASIPVYLYILAFLMITLPLAALTVLYFKTKFPLVGYGLVSLGTALLVPNFIAPFFYNVIVIFCSDDPVNFDDAHHVAFLLIYSVVLCLFQILSLYFGLHLVDKKNQTKVQHTLSVGPFYYLFTAMSMALSFVSYARVAIHERRGTLDAMVKDNLTLEQLTEYVGQIKDGIVLSTLAQFLSTLLLAVSLSVAMILIFHALRKKKFLNVFFAFLIQLGTVLIINFAEYFFGLGADVAVMGALMILFAVVIVLYFRWYRKEREDYQKKMAEYKEYLKTKKD